LPHPDFVGGKGKEGEEYLGEKGIPPAVLLFFSFACE